jgi:hypothetical protein
MESSRVGTGRSGNGIGLVIAMAAVIAAGLIGQGDAWAGTPLGPDTQLFGIVAGNSIDLAPSSTISFVNQSGAPPEVGALWSATLNGPTTYLTGDLIVEPYAGTIEVDASATVVGQCVVAAGGSIVDLGSCGSTDTSGNNPLLTTLNNAEIDVVNYAIFLNGLTPTKTLGDISLKKYQNLTVKLPAGTSVVSIGNITAPGGNTITLTAPRGAVVVVNISGTLSLGGGSQVFAAGGGLNPHNLIWNIQSANPTFNANVTIAGTVMNVVDNNVAITFKGRSAINGAVLSNGNVIADGPMHLNFWPFTAAPEDSVSPCFIGRFGQKSQSGPQLERPAC